MRLFEAADSDFLLSYVNRPAVVPDDDRKSRRSMWGSYVRWYYGSVTRTKREGEGEGEEDTVRSGTSGDRGLNGSQLTRSCIEI